MRKELRARGSEPWSELRLDGEEFPLRTFVGVLQTGSLFSERLFVHVRRAEKIPSDAVKALLPYLKRPLPEGRYFVFEGEKLDQRSALYRLVAERGRVEELPPPTRRELPGLVRQMLRERGLKLPAAAVRFLLEYVEENPARFAREIEKLALYAGGKSLSPEDLSGLIYSDKGANVFTALDALLARDPEALKLLREVLEGGEEPTKVFYLLAAQTRKLLAVKSLAAEGLSAEGIARRTGEFAWLVKKRLALARRLSVQELVRLLQDLHEEDVRMKRGERRPDDAVWAVAFGWLFRPQPRGAGAGASGG